jgi:hypothetical protein
MRPSCGKDTELCCQDTDPYVCHIQTEVFYEDMKTMINYFDTSHYPENNI